MTEGGNEERDLLDTVEEPDQELPASTPREPRSANMATLDAPLALWRIPKELQHHRVPTQINQAALVARVHHLFNAPWRPAAAK